MGLFALAMFCFGILFILASALTVEDNDGWTIASGILSSIGCVMIGFYLGIVLF